MGHGRPGLCPDPTRSPASVQASPWRFPRTRTTSISTLTSLKCPRIYCEPNPRLPSYRKRPHILSSALRGLHHLGASTPSGFPQLHLIRRGAPERERWLDPGRLLHRERRRWSRREEAKGGETGTGGDGGTDSHPALMVHPSTYIPVSSLGRSCHPFTDDGTETQPG